MNAQTELQTTIRSLLPLLDILRDQPALLADIQQRFHFSFDHVHSSVSLSTYKSVLQYLRAAGISDIGYRLGWAIDIGTFGVIDFYLHCHDNLQDALSELLRLSPLIARHVAVPQIEIHGDQFVLTASAPDLGDEGDLLRYQALATMLVRYLQLLLHDSRCVPLKTETPITRAMAPAHHQQYFGSNIVYGGSRFAIYYPKSLLSKVLRNSNATVRNALRPEVDQLLKLIQSQSSMQQKLLDWLSAQTDLAGVTQAAFAEQLALSESSLKRRLAEESTTFSEVLNGFRRGQTLHLLADEQNKIDYIARMLGFSERSAFERAFRQWFAITPAQFRFETVQCRLQSEQPNGTALDKLPPLPKIAQDIVVLMQSDRYDMRQLLALIQQEPVLSARILGLANSAYYAAGRVNTLNEAVTRVLGTETVRNLVLVLMCSDRLQHTTGQFDRRQHWLNAFAVAQLARAISRRIKQPIIDGDACQLLGLLHNLGALLLAYTRPKETELLLAQRENIAAESDWPALEMRVYGIDRYIAAAVLLTHWHLPQELCQRLRQLSDVELGCDDPVVVLVHHVIDYVGDQIAGGLALSRSDMPLSSVLVARDREFAALLEARFRITETETIKLLQEWRGQLPSLSAMAEMLA